MTFTLFLILSKQTLKCSHKCIPIKMNPQAVEDKCNPLANIVVLIFKNENTVEDIIIALIIIHSISISSKNQ